LYEFAFRPIAVALGIAQNRLSHKSAGWTGPYQAGIMVIRKEIAMGEIVHTSRSRIVREHGPTRRAVIQGFEGTVRYGVHGGIKNFYKIEPKEEHPATLDHIVSATAA
jgi:hypothetical protein